MLNLRSAREIAKMRPPGLLVWEAHRRAGQLVRPGATTGELDAVVEQLFNELYANEGYELAIDLEAQQVVTPSGEAFGFDVDAFRKHCLLGGLDDIGLTLEDADAIRSYEAARRQDAPWLFDAVK